MRLAAVGVALCFPLLAVAQQSEEMERRQEEIRAQVRMVAVQVGEIISEFERNGLGQGEDVEALRQLQAVLEKLSTEQINAVVAALRSGGITQAHDRQQQVLNQFRSVLTEYQRQQSEYALAARVRGMMERQHLALRTTVDLIEALGPRASQRPDETTRASLDVQSRDQSLLASEVGDLLDLLDHAPTGQGVGVQAGGMERFAQGARFAREVKLLESLRQASGDLTRGAMFNAAQVQQQTRNNLRKLWRLISPPRDRMRQLSDAALEVQQLVELQSGITRLVRDARGDEVESAGRRQGDAVDRAMMLAEEVVLLLPQAGEGLSEGVREMQGVRARLRKSEKEPALAGSEQVIQRLTAVRAMLLEEAEKLRDASTPTPPSETDSLPGDRLDRVTRLLDETRRLREQNAQGAPVEDQARQLSKQAERDAQEAAVALDQASRESQAKGRDEQLAQAEKRLEERLEQLKQAQRQLESVEQAQESVRRAQESQAQASQAAEDAARSGEEKREEKARAARAEQKEASEQTERAKALAEKDSPAAGESLNKAQEEMEQAEKELVEKSPSRARECQRQAEDRLSEAQSQLEAQADRLREELGKESNDAAQARAADEAVKKATEEARQAEASLGEGDEPTESQAQGMSQSAKDLEKAGSESSGAVPEESKRAMQRAAEAMRQGAAQAGAGDREGAKKSARRAQEELAKAAPPPSSASGNAAQAIGKPAGQASPDKPPSDSTPPDSPDASDPTQANANRGASPDGPRGEVPDTSGRFIGLPAREREALLQSQRQKLPEEYAAQIEQYLRNLSKKESQP